MQPWTDLVASLASEHAFSGVIHLTHGDQTLASSAFGLADRTHRVANRPDTRFAIASGTIAAG